MPVDGPRPEDVRAALERLLAWPGLVRSPQLGRFLAYVVEARLRGEAEAIKAYAIAVDVLQRPQDFDPQSDPIVRVQARRLRTLLDDYYAGEGAGEPVRIRLPVGRYVPEFEAVAADDRGRVEMDAEAAPPPVGPPTPVRLAGAPRTPLVVALAAVTIGLLASLALFIGAPRAPHPVVPGAPVVAVAEFQVVDSGNAALRASIAGLAVQLVQDLRAFPTIGGASLMGTADDLPSRPDAFYVLSGVARSEGGVVQITATLKPYGSDVTIWSQTEPGGDATPAGIADASRAFAERLGSPRGPLQADSNRWLVANRVTPGAQTEYVCMLLYARYRDSGSDDDRMRATDCAALLANRLPDSQVGLALNAALAIDEAQQSPDSAATDRKALKAAEGLLDQADAIASTSVVVREQLARLAEAQGNLVSADANYAAALQLNRADLDVLAEYGRMLSLSGDSPRGRNMSQRALASALPPAPFWYYAAPAANAYRDGDDGGALKAAEMLATGDSELGAAIAVAAAQRNHDQTALDRDIAELLQVKRFRSFGVLPVLKQRLADADLVDSIAGELRAAGIPASALDGPF